MIHNPSPYMRSQPPDLSPEPLQRGDETPHRYPIHWILHLGRAWGDEGSPLLSYDDMISLYGLENEPYVSRFAIDILDDIGGVHLFPPHRSDPHPPKTMKHLAAGVMRTSRMYRDLITKGELYKKTKFPEAVKNKDLSQPGRSIDLQTLIDLTSPLKTLEK